MQESSFKLVSIGRATQNKARASRHLNVLAVELAAATDGEVTHNPLEEVITGFDAEGHEYNVKTITTRDIDCEWLPNEDNRVTPPDIRRGELVEIWRMADTEQYYWRCMGLRNNLRTLESVVYAWNASPEAGGGGIDFDKCYYLAISAHDGHITLGTSKANGEPFKYTLQLNTKEGSVALTDDVGNYFELNSKERSLELKNADNSFIKIEKQWMNLEAERYIQMKVKDTVFKLTPESIVRSTKELDSSTVNGTTVKLTPTAIDTQTSVTKMKSSSSHSTEAPNVQEITDRWEIV